MRDELLRDLFVVVDVRSWLCLRARGTGGGVRFCTAKPSAASIGSSALEGMEGG